MRVMDVVYMISSKISYKTEKYQLTSVYAKKCVRFATAPLMRR